MLYIFKSSHFLDILEWILSTERTEAELDEHPWKIISTDSENSYFPLVQACFLAPVALRKSLLQIHSSVSPSLLEIIPCCYASTAEMKLSFFAIGICYF